MIAVTLIFAVMLSGSVYAANGDVIYVSTNGNDDNDGYSLNTAKLSIKNATGTVNENGTVRIANGRYTGVNNTGISIGRNMAIIGQSKAGTIINAEHSNRIFNIDSGVTVTIKNLTLANGTAFDGAAIHNHGKTTVTNCIFTGNDAEHDGGAIYGCSGVMTITDCTFTNNYAEYDGGAINNEDQMTVADSTFTGNEAYDCCGGGAIYNDDELTVTGCTFTDNEATYSDGGAIYNEYEMTITNCTFTNNYADDVGGAICNKDDMTITNCTFKNNTAEDGGAIFNKDEMTVADSIFTGNEAYDCCGGGAIYNDYELTVTGCTFTGNEATYSDGGAIYNEDELTVTNCTFTNNYADYDGGAICNDGEMTINFCRIVGNSANDDGNAIYSGKGIKALSAEPSSEYSVDAKYNWWGSNKPDFDKLISGDVDYTPWLYMTINANPKTIKNGETSLITVSFNNYSSDGINYSPLSEPLKGHIPDGTPVTFNTDKGSIGCKTIEKQTVNGIATATLTADETAGIAHVNAVTDSQKVDTEVTITPKSGLYLTVTPSKANPVVGDTVVYTLKVGNNGPDSAKDVVMTYVIPEGFEFAGAKVDVGTYAYDPATRTITWTIDDVPVGDPYMWLSLHVTQSGHYLINPVLSTSTYDPTINIDTQSMTVNALEESNTVKAASKTKTIPLQHTGLPITGLALAVLMLMGGLIPRRK